ncbi:phosphatase PAP2 family protein [Rhodopseudomonas sp. B29]|uniref:phosphatase PAP2 family protein n=1 Tax=Rhodopseudomonas sp. B29 TaxID=95607 RepID=UPI0003B4817D|nr:phosphatase PAP2 family protein [Rhodopseudomonas sp. B29]
MTDAETSHAWRCFNRNWIVLGVLALALGVGVAVTDFSIQIGTRALVPLGLTMVVGAIGYATRGIFQSRLAFICGALVQLKALSLLMPPLTYIAASANLPLQDANLAAFDAMLGLDWPAYFRFFIDRPDLIPFAHYGYAMIFWPILGVPLALGLAGQYRRLQQFTLASALTLIVTTLVFIWTPAMGTFYHYGIEADTALFKAGGCLGQMHDLPMLRDGTLRILKLGEFNGIIEFPSFHAAAAVLSMWSLWCIWWLRPWALIANVGMLLATPLVGGHYFIDIFAGAALAMLSIAVARIAMQPRTGAAVQAAATSRQQQTSDLQPVASSGPA